MHVHVCVCTCWVSMCFTVFHIVLDIFLPINALEFTASGRISVYNNKGNHTSWQECLITTPF